jgi:glutathione S-transferase
VTRLRRNEGRLFPFNKKHLGDIFIYWRLVGRKYICDEYSIVDMACWPWVLTYKSQNIDLDEFPEIRRWYDQMKTRPALRRDYDLLKETRSKRGSEGKVKLPDVTLTAA